MGTSERTINQVRAILEKLERSIDAAREKRLDPQPPASAGASVAPAGGGAASQPDPDRPIGRARPLRPSGGQGSAFQRFASEG
jgi:hypothetical protein